MPARRDRSKSERSDVKRTRKAIEDAYNELIFEKAYDKITVTDVINRAGISRGTFYAYYSDIRDLADDAGYRLLERIRGLIRDAAHEHLLSDPRKMVDIIISDYEKHKQKVVFLYEMNGRAGLLEKLKSRVKEGIADGFGEIDEPERSIVISCVVGALLDCCIDRTLTDAPIDRDRFVDIVTGFIAHGTAYFSKE